MRPALAHNSIQTILYRLRLWLPKLPLLRVRRRYSRRTPRRPRLRRTRSALTALSATSSDSQDQRQPSVYGVFQSYNWQATAGYTFFRFYVVPHVTDNMNGINLGLQYYPGGKWFAADGEFVGAWGTNYGIGGTKYVQGMGGGRVRWSAPRGLEVWGHALVGGSHFLPQTSMGSNAAFAYEAGGGVDLNIHQKRIAYRVSANMVGTRYFGTYQYSPNVSIGVVFKF